MALRMRSLGLLSRFCVNPIPPAQDGDRARRFYRDVLGLDLLTGPTDHPMVFGAAQGSSIALSEMPERIPPPYPTEGNLTSLNEFVG